MLVVLSMIELPSESASAAEMLGGLLRWRVAGRARSPATSDTAAPPSGTAPGAGHAPAPRNDSRPSRAYSARSNTVHTWRRPGNSSMGDIVMLAADCWNDNQKRY